MKRHVLGYGGEGEALRKACGKSRGVGRQRIVQRNQTVWRTGFRQVNAQAEGLADGSVIQEKAGQAGRIKYAAATADDRLRSPEEIVGKTGSWSKIIKIRTFSRRRKTDAVERIAYEEQPRGRTGNNFGFHSSSIGVRPELLGTPKDFLHDTLRLPTESQSEGQPRQEFPSVLKV